MQANPVETIKKDIYIIKNDINNKVYIGQSKNVEERFVSHCKASSSSLLSEAIQQYGKEHFWYEIIEHNISNYDEMEKYWIQHYNSIAPYGYNIQDGGSDPPIFYGDNHFNCSISDENVIKLKHDLRNTNISLNDLAKKYHISKRQVLRINQGISRTSPEEEYPIRKKPNINGKLTEDDVDIIIDMLRHTYLLNGQIAKRFNVSVHMISNINSGMAHKRDNEKYPIRKWKSCGVILFTYEQVTKIIKLLQHSPLSIREIAKQNNVDVNSIYMINNGSSKKYRRDNIKYPIRKY